MKTPRTGYATDVTDDEWAFVLPYLTLMREDAPQRTHDLRAVLNAVRYQVKTGTQWRMLPNDFPPWEAVYQQAARWVRAGVFEAMAHDLRQILRLAAGREAEPTGTIIDSRTLPSTPESGARAGFDGAKKKKGSKVSAGVDTLGNLLAVRVTAANEQDRAQVAAVARAVQAATGGTVEVMFADQGDTGETAAEAAKAEGIELIVVKHTEPKRGFVLLPKRWVVERTFGWLGRFRRLARDYERTAEMLAGYHWAAAVILMLRRAAEHIAESA